MILNFGIQYGNVCLNHYKLYNYKRSSGLIKSKNLNQFQIESRQNFKKFDYTNCQLDSKFYIYDTTKQLNSKIKANLINTSFSLVDSPIDVCFLIVILDESPSNQILSDLFDFLILYSNNNFIFVSYFNQEKKIDLRNFLLNTFSDEKIKILINNSFFASFDQINYFYNINFGLIDHIDQTEDFKFTLNRLNKVSILTETNFENSNVFKNSKFVVIPNKLKFLIESIKFGCIPIINDLEINLPLSDLIAWDELVIKVPSYVNSFLEILDTMSINNIEKRQIKARMIYKAYFKTQTEQIKTILTVLLNKVKMPLKSFDFFQYTELEPEFMSKEIVKKINAEKNISTLKNKFSQSNYILWNKIYYPFNLVPSNPFFELNYEPNEQFTILFLTFNRELNVVDSIGVYFNKLDLLNSIIIVWNSLDTEPNWQLWSKYSEYFEQNRLKIIKFSKNSLNNRFLPIDLIKTDAVFSLDDDLYYEPWQIMLNFQAWKENRDRLVGIPARRHVIMKDGSLQYKLSFDSQYSMVLTGAAFYHRFYQYYYSYIMDKRIFDLVDELMNGEDSLNKPY
ncbi:unnamed protein product [Brachionus calyciflorus]|uniref:Glycosyl transferase 64 domain-containing protein n=1 Tax=Brachionus calyciflorus TaxID=104777 RepID=A0A814F2N5_9BILA|nr:unnamed protein product [Brachionus calyciflorus]